MLAKNIRCLHADEYGPNCIGHIVRMQEKIGPGGAGCRFRCSSFLQEAAAVCALPELELLAERLNTIGDAWRSFALQAVRMIKGRDPVDFSALAVSLQTLADQESDSFRALRKAVQ